MSSLDRPKSLTKLPDAHACMILYWVKVKGRTLPAPACNHWWSESRGRKERSGIGGRSPPGSGLRSRPAREARSSRDEGDGSASAAQRLAKSPAPPGPWPVPWFSYPNAAARLTQR